MPSGTARRFLVVLTALLLALCSACSMTPLNAHVSTTAATSVSSVASTTSFLDPEQPDETTVPAIDLNGYVWSIRVPWADRLLPNADDTESDRQLLAIYNALCSDYNAVIDISYAPSLSECIADAAAGVCPADVLGIRSFEIPVLATSKAIYAADDPVLLNAGLNCNDKTRFLTDISSQARYDGKQWAVQLASEYDIPAFGQVLLCNQTLLDRLGTGNLYNLLETGKWTLSEYTRLAAAASALSSTTYGTALTSPRSAYLSLGGSIVSRRDGAWSCELTESASVKALSELRTLTFSSSGMFSGTPAEAKQLFIDGKLLFLWTDTASILDTPALTASGTAILMPVPTGSAARRTPVTGYCGYAFPANNITLRNSVILFNALAQRLNGDWVAAFVRQANLGTDAVRVIRNWILPAVTVTADEFDVRFQAFFDRSVYEPMLEGDLSPDEVLDAAASSFYALIRSFEVSSDGAQRNAR